MTFDDDDATAAYDLFTGRYSAALAPAFLRAADPAAGRPALDVGCGTGALTTRLVERLGATLVSAVDPSPAFVDAVGHRLPGVDVRRATAEALPHPDASFQLVAAQLVVHFLADPVAGLREMARVTAPGGVVAACVWDNGGGAGPLSPLWDVARELDPRVRDEGGAPGAREGHLAELFRLAGLPRTETSRLAVEVPFRDLEEWWEPLRRGVGSGGAYVAGLDDGRRDALHDRLRIRFGAGAFVARVRAWCVRAEVSACG